MPDILTLLQLGVFAMLGDSNHSKKKQKKFPNKSQKVLKTITRAFRTFKASPNVFTSNVMVIERLKAAELIVLLLEK